MIVGAEMSNEEILRIIKERIDDREFIDAIWRLITGAE